MALKPYLVGPIEAGLQRNLEPWILPEDAFETLENAYVWRGRVKKRFGYSLLGATDLDSRLRINIGTTAAVTGNLPATTMPGTVFEVGQMFSIGTTVFTVNVLGTAATLLTTGTATGTYDTTTGSLIITGNTENPSTAVYFYPAQPVMGLLVRESAAVNRENIIGFDTQFSYFRSGGAWEQFSTGSFTVWTGTDSSFFWGANFRAASPYIQAFYTVNYTRADHIRYLEEQSSTWKEIFPQLDAGGTRKLQSAKIILGFQDRLIVLNTLELEGVNERVFPMRCRFSQNGDPTADATSWLDTVRGRGGYIDAPTSQQIVTADIVKGRLVVYFERSTWELQYTGYPDLPFRWQQLNNELGCESTFSVVGFDESILGVGNVGIHSTNGINVTRIDQKIPDEVYKIHNGNQGPQRVYGIRDYFPELVYWTFPSESGDPTYPNRVLIYNYRNQTWAIFKDSFTCFGYFQKENDITWATIGQQYPTWAAWNAPWKSGELQSSFPAVVAGNQQGFVVNISTGDATNDQLLYINDITPGTTTQLDIINHNFEGGESIRIEEVVGVTNLNDIIFVVQAVTDPDFITISTPNPLVPVGTYTGGGKIRRVSNFNILTKEFNPGTRVGSQFRMPHLDFLLSTTEQGELTVNYFLDSRKGTSVSAETNVGVLLGNDILFTKPEELFPEQKGSVYNWHRFFVQAHGQFIQLQLTLSAEQMSSWDIANQGFELQAMMLYVEKDARLVG